VKNKISYIALVIFFSMYALFVGTQGYCNKVYGKNYVRFKFCVELCSFPSL